MATDDQQTRIGGDIGDNASTTPAANVSAVKANANTAAFEEMFTAFKKKSEEQEKLIGSLAKQVETLTARTRAVIPRGATKVRRRRLDFATPLDRPETTPAAARKNSENLTPLVRETEDNEREQDNLDLSNQSGNSDEDVDVHPRRTRSRPDTILRSRTHDRRRRKYLLGGTGEAIRGASPNHPQQTQTSSENC